MSKNRKYKSTAVRFAPAIKALVLCSLFGGAALGYVWQREQIHRLGIRFRELEDKSRQLDLANNQLRIRISTQLSGSNLMRAVREMNLGLGPVQREQQVLLPEPSMSPATQETGRVAEVTAPGVVLPMVGVVR